MNGGTWRAVAPELARRFLVVAPDLRGHGDSDWSPTLDYSLGDMAHDVTEILIALGLQPRLAVGMSLGGMVAAVLAASHHELEGVIMVDVGPQLQHDGVVHRTEWNQRTWFASVDDAVSHVVSLDPIRQSPLAFERLRAGVKRNLRRDGSGFAWKWDPGRHSAPGMKGSARASQMRTALPLIACQVGVLRGERSDVFGQAEADVLQGLVPRAQILTVVGAGHAVHRDNPRGFLDAIHHMLDGWGGPGLLR